MARYQVHRSVKWLLGIVVFLCVALAIIAYVAASKVEAIAREWLGDTGTAAEVSVAWDRVVMKDVLISTPKGWPGKQALKAGTVEIKPRWHALLSNKVDISAITVSDFELTVYRKRSGGIDVLPSLREHAKERAAKRSGEKRESAIGRLSFVNGKVDFYDGQISTPPHHIPITNVQARIGPLDFPQLSTRTDISVTGSIEGRPNPGKLDAHGWIVLASRDARFDSSLTNVAIRHMAPYLQHGTKLAFDGGRVGLTLKTDVQNRQINADGTLVLSHLKLANDGLLALPRKAAIAAIEDSDGHAEFKFTLSGPISKPTFKLEDSLSTKIAGGLTGVLGISIEGLVNGIGHTVEGIGSALGNLTGSENN